MFFEIGILSHEITCYKNFIVSNEGVKLKMYKVIEKRNRDGIYFIKQFVSDDDVLCNEIVQIKCSSVNLVEKNYKYLYDSKMNPISSVFVYINFELQNQSPNDITLAITALKLLYSFLELYCLNIKTLSDIDAKNLILFLEGTSRKGTLYDLKLGTIRKYDTIGYYLTVYRKYVKFLKITDSIFLVESPKVAKILNNEMDSLDSEIYKEKYEIGTKSYKPQRGVPKYISIPEFKRILNIIRKEYTIREECIVRLLFEGGMRLGEVLGLTDEDVVTNGNISKVYIRNRCSDSFDQMAKTCMKVKDPNQYSSGNYNTEKVGYQIVIANNNLIDLVNDYVNEYHTKNTPNFIKNYNKYTIADSCIDYNNKNSRNFYLFINSVGRPLTANLWNKTLREIFEKAGLILDKKHKKNNLSHRFRHGFGMFMVKYKKATLLELKDLMRHNSIKSAEKYFNPTDEEIIELKTDFVNSMYDAIFELNIKGW
jgi:site-specific recombinase XerD